MISKKVIFVALTLLLLGCAREEEPEVIRSINVDQNNCKDFVVNLAKGGFSSLSSIILDDNTPIIGVTQLTSGVEVGSAVNDKDVQVGNYGGVFKGYIIFVDKEGKTIVSEGKLDIKIYQVKSILRDIDRTLIFSDSREIKKNDFKSVKFIDHGVEEESVAYYFDNIKLGGLEKDPLACVAMMEYNFTNKDGTTFSSQGMILLNDLEQFEISEFTSNPLLWEIEGDKPSYLYGTIHIPDRRVLSLPEPVWKAMDSIDVLYTETPMDLITQTKAVKSLFLEEGNTLHNTLPNEVYKKLDKYFLLEGISILRFSQIKPWVMGVMIIYSEFFKEENLLPSLDSYLRTVAIKKGKDVDGLETSEEHNSFFESLTKDEEVIFLEEILDSIGEFDEYTINISELFIKAYLIGDTDEVKELVLSSVNESGPLADKFEDVLFTKRNHLMSDRIANTIKNNPTKSFFFAVGAGHYPGEEGIIKLLEKKGLKISRVKFSQSENCDDPATSLGKRCYVTYDADRTIGPSNLKNKNDLCEKITADHLRGYCYYDIAWKNQEVSFCFNLEEDTKEECVYSIALEGKNPKYCSYLNSEIRDICYLDLAIEIYDSELCKKFSFYPASHAICYGYFASESGDKGYCGLIDNEIRIMDTFEYRDEWEYLYPKYGSKTYKQICEEKPILLTQLPSLYDGYLDKKSFYYLNDSDYLGAEQEFLLDQITKNKEYDRCNEIEYKPYKEICIKMKVGESSACESDETHRDFCYYKFAVNNLNPDGCEKIESIRLVDKCYGLIALATS